MATTKESYLGISFAILLLLPFYDGWTDAKPVYLLGTWDGIDELETATIEYALMETNKNHAFELKLLERNTTFDMFQYASFLLDRKTVALLEVENALSSACPVSTVTGLPLLRLYTSHNPTISAGVCNYSISLAMDYNSYILATVDLLNRYHFHKIAMLYEGHRFYEVTKFQSAVSASNLHLRLVRIDGRRESNPSDLAKQAMKEVEGLKPDAILLYAEQNYWPLLMKELNSDPSTPNVWIIQSELPRNISVEGNNMVAGFQLPRNETDATERLVNHLAVKSGTPNLTIYGIRESAFLMYDAILAIERVISDMIKHGKWVWTNATGASTSINGQGMMQFFGNAQVNGSTGIIEFEKTGARKVHKLEILNLRDNVFFKIGTWDSSKQVQITSGLRKNKVGQFSTWGNIHGRHLRVVTVEVHPFIFRKPSDNGQVHYEGYCIDLLDKLADMLKFTYEIYHSPDGKYGSMSNGTWNGMIKELIDEKANLAVAAMTVNEQRSKAVSFTVSYMYYTEEMLMKKEQIEEVNFLQFMDPFDVLVWVMTLVCLIAVTLCIYLINRFTPIQNKDERGNDGTSDEFSLINSLWFSLACMLQQGADSTPRSISGRILAGCYWFCILVWVSTYTANLAAFFTVNNAVTPINNIEDAAKSDYDIGVTKGTNLYSFFRSAEYELYRGIWYKMEAKNSLPNSTINGIHWVRTKSKYIHMSDGPILKYAASRKPCNLVTIPGLTAARGMGFALNMKDPATRNLSLALLRLREIGYLSTLQRKWWDSRSQCPKESTKSTLGKKRIKFSSMTGVYMVLTAGIVLSFTALGAEICWFKKGRQQFWRFRARNSPGTTTVHVQPSTINGSAAAFN